MKSDKKQRGHIASDGLGDISHVASPLCAGVRTGHFAHLTAFVVSSISTLPNGGDKA